MDATRQELIMQRWKVIQHELLPELRDEVGPLTAKLEKVSWGLPAFVWVQMA